MNPPRIQHFAYDVPCTLLDGSCWLLCLRPELDFTDIAFPSEFASS